MMRWIPAILALLAAAPAWGDILILKDGTRMEGTIVKETTDSVKIEITSGGQKAILTIPKKDVKEIKKVPIDYSKVLPPREYYEKRIKEIAEDDAKGYFELGVFAFEKGLYREAGTCLERAKTLDETYRGRAKDYLYKIRVYRDRECKVAFEQALQVLAGGRILVAREEFEKFREAFDDCELATDKVVQGKLIKEKYPDLAEIYGTDLETIVKAVAERAEKVCRECQGKKTIGCPDCGGTGDAACNLCEGGKTIPCEDCGGNAEVKCTVCKGYGKTERYDGRKRVREECKPCKGTGLVACSTCKKGQVECTLCKGKGVVKKGCEACASEGKVTCTACDGTGEKESEAEGGEGRRKRRFGG